MAACLLQLEGWRVSTQGADGALPLPGVYGVPEQWPHVQALYEAAGFVHQGRVEIVFMVNVSEIPRPARPDLKVQRSVGVNGTRLSGLRGDEVVGYIEVESREAAGRTPQHGGWADIGNLHVAQDYCRQGVGSWLLGQAAEWLELGRFDRLLTYAWPKEDAHRSFVAKAGFRELTWTKRGWRRAGRSIS